MFVAIEGIDGSGKSTVINKLMVLLKGRGFKVHATSEPSQSMIGKLIRDWLLKPNSEVAHPSVFALLFVADRVQHYYSEVKPLLDKGYVVISERYMESTLAYQGAMGLPIDWLVELHRFVPKPDLTIVLDVPIDVAVARLRSRHELEVFEVDREFLGRVRDFLLGRVRENGYPIIDASRDVDSVVHDILELVVRHRERLFK
ncbi:MAG: dTMP kinase [Vulcanisaeta sp. AZ3]